MPKCPACKSENPSLWSIAKDYEYFTSEKEFSYYQCPDCLTIFIDPIPLADLYLIYPSNYYSFVKTIGNPVSEIKEWLDRKHFKNLLKKIKGDSIKVLDVGGGQGWVSDLVRKTDKRVTSTTIVDIDGDAKKIAIANGHDYFEGRLEEFHSNEKYDLILMLNLIEHVENPQAIINKASGLLSKEGIILIKTPNSDCWDARLFQNGYWGGLHAPRHWIIFSEKSFKKLIPGTGLKIQSLEYTQGAPFWAFSFITLLHKKGMVRISANRPIVYHPLFAIISGLTAAIDFLRAYFVKTAQMFIVLKASTHNTQE